MFYSNKTWITRSNSVNDNIPTGLRGVRFESGQHRVILETIKWYLLLLCLARKTKSDSMGKYLGPYAGTAQLLCTVLDKGRAIKGLVVCCPIPQSNRMYIAYCIVRSDNGIK